MKDNIDFTLLASDEIKKHVNALTPQLISEQAAGLTQEQIPLLIAALSDPTVESYLEKLIAALYALNEPNKLESAGRALNIAQVEHILTETLKNEHLQRKLLPILVGMPNHLFSELMLLADKKQLKALQIESSSEPVQHHITILHHELDKTLSDVESEVATIELKVKSLDLETLSKIDLDYLNERFFNLKEKCTRSVKKSENALAVAWNSGRTDLIEKLSHTKETYQRTLRHEIGHPKFLDENATGLHSLLESRLADIYGNPSDTEDLEAIRDEEPAIEALTKLSIWYLKDYWELGLLPGISDISELDLDPSKHSELERVKHRDILFKEVENNLESIGIVNTRDLKDRFIASKSMLQEYISKPWSKF